MKEKSQYGHVGMVTGARWIKSPCHDAIPKEILSPPDENGFSEIKDVCSICKKEYQAREFDVV